MDKYFSKPRFACLEKTVIQKRSVIMKMKYAITILVGLPLLLNSCISARQAEGPDLLQMHQQRLAAVQNAEAPLPAKTPFDGNPADRRIYLEYYEKGYRTGLTGISLTHCGVEHPDHAEAEIKGWYEGQCQGAIKSMGMWNEKEGQNQILERTR